MILGASGLPRPVVGQTLDWTLDADTGALWREMTSEELDAVGWSGHQGWLTKEYGGLDGFRNGEDTTIDVAYHGSVQSLAFSRARTLWKVLAELKVLPVVAAPDDLPVPDPTTVYRETSHAFDGPGDWYAEYSVNASQWTASTVLDDEEIWIFPDHPDLELTGGEDYVYAISAGPCAEASSSDDGGSDGGGGTSTTGESLCSAVNNLAEEASDNPVPFTMFMFGEVEFCESDEYGDNRHTVLGNHKDHVKEAHETTPTRATIEATARMCTVTTSDHTWDHNRNDWVHAHDDEGGNWHPWAFNVVQRDQIEDGHGTDPDTDPDHSYIDAEVWLDCFCSWADYDGKRGPEAWMRHFVKYHGDEHGDVAGETAVVYHLDRVGGSDGWGDDPGRRAVVGGQTDPSKTLSTHETGHNLNADHCKASGVNGGDWTVMVNPPCSYYNESDVNGWVNHFSDANKDIVNQCLSNSCWT